MVENVHSDVEKEYVSGCGSDTRCWKKWKYLDHDHRIGTKSSNLQCNSVKYRTNVG